MKTLRSIFKPLRPSSGRFDRYYGGILRSGSGYPTADEAKRDLRYQDQVSTQVIGWLR